MVMEVVVGRARERAARGHPREQADQQKLNPASFPGRFTVV